MILCAIPRLDRSTVELQEIPGPTLFSACNTIVVVFVVVVIFVVTVFVVIFDVIIIVIFVLEVHYLTYVGADAAFQWLQLESAPGPVLPHPVGRCKQPGQ